ncbi:MAG: hypothetical protein JXB26_06385 [Candidatus Aminicenantes bacterium]|nr:hypothetical protein [Candidatus Aminicenantes bacterium]
MKRNMLFILALMVFICLSLSAQKAEDMVGTWIGTATLEGEADPNDLTLVLALEDGVLTGHMTDQYGTMNETAIEEARLEEGVFTFSLNLETPQGQFLLKFTMNVSGDTMEGKLEVPDMGLGGTWEATKQK